MLLGIVLHHTKAVLDDGKDCLHYIEIVAKSVDPFLIKPRD